MYSIQGSAVLVYSGILLFLLVTLCWSFYSPANITIIFVGEEVYAQSNLDEKTTVNPNNFLTYENSTYGVRINYPADWSYYESGVFGGLLDIAVFQSPLEGRTDPASSIFSASIDTVTDKNISLEEYVDQLIPSLTESMSGFNYKIVESKIDDGITLAGRPAYQIVSTYTQDGINFRTLDMVIPPAALTVVAPAVAAVPPGAPAAPAAPAAPTASAAPAAPANAATPSTAAALATASVAPFAAPAPNPVASVVPPAAPAVPAAPTAPAAKDASIFAPIPSIPPHIPAYVAPPTHQGTSPGTP